MPDSPANPILREMIRIGPHAGACAGVSATPSAFADLPLVRDAAVGLGALAAGLFTQLFDHSHWYWAMVAAVAAMGGRHLPDKLVRGLHRLEVFASRAAQVRRG